MANGTVAPFFQLGRKVAFTLLNGSMTEEVRGEVVDTDPGWLAVQAEDANAIIWYNLDYITSIRVLGQIGHE